MLPKLPSRIDILNVPLGRTQGSQGGFYAQTDAAVTAHLEGSNVRLFSIRNIQTKDVVTEQEGPHGPIEVLEFAQMVIGSGPIDVTAGQALLVTVDFVCPADSATATFDGRVAIEGFPAPAGIPVLATAALGKVTATSLDSPAMLPGNKANFNFRIFSSKAHDVSVDVIYDTAFESRFSAPTQSLVVPAGGTVDLSVPISCAPGTPEGKYSLNFHVFTADGSVFFGSVKVSATVTRTVRVFTNLPSDFTLLHGDDALCELRVVVSGSPAQVSVAHGPIPDGLKVTPDSRSLTVDGMAFTNFDFEVRSDAALGRLAPLSLFWTVSEPEIVGRLVFNVEVVSDRATLPLLQPLSQLSQENNPRPLICDRAVLTISDSGSWNLSAHLENQETQADVSFLFEVRLNADGVSFGETIDGALSAAGDGPATRTGLRTLGYPPAGTFQRHGVFAALQVPNLFQNAKASSAQYRMLAAFGEPDAGNIPDPPDEVEASTQLTQGTDSV